jgi:geranylgeranyl pyrophosphate synthase
MSVAPSPIHPPTLFLGVFSNAVHRFLPLLEEARERLRVVPVPEVVRDHYLFLVERAQPTFVLFPLMYLHLADATGGVTARHREYLPWQMLAMELIGLYDDTIDYTPLRSGEPTYSARHGAPAATALSGFIFSTLAHQTTTTAPEFSPLLARLFENLCAHEIWEHESRYPEVSTEAFSRFIRRRCDAIPPVNAYALDGALLLRRMGTIPHAVHERFGDLQQDVDDLVNILEFREAEGENDDIKLGVASVPLLATIRAEPRAGRLLEELWRPLREASIASRRAAVPTLSSAADLDEIHREIVALVRRHGVEPTVDKVLRDCAFVEREAPPHVKAMMRLYAYSFLDRLRDYDPRARFEAHT